MPLAGHFKKRAKMHVIFFSVLIRFTNAKGEADASPLFLQ